MVPSIYTWSIVIFVSGERPLCLSMFVVAAYSVPSTDNIHPQACPVPSHRSCVLFADQLNLRVGCDRFWHEALMLGVKEQLREGPANVRQGVKSLLLRSPFIPCKKSFEQYSSSVILSKLSSTAAPGFSLNFLCDSLVFVAFESLAHVPLVRCPQVVFDFSIRSSPGQTVR